MTGTAYHEACERAAQAIAARSIIATRVTRAGAPQTKEELRDWIRDTTGWRIPCTAVCPDHCSPMDFIWQIFAGEVTDALVLANRGGGKTLCFALLHLCNAFWKPGHETSHFGAILAQATRAYNYYERAIKRPTFAPLVPSPRRTGAIWENGSLIEILPGSRKQARGGHPNVVAYDEVESADPVSYNNAKAMAMERELEGEDAEPGQFISGSTREEAAGLMQKALDDAAGKGTPIVEWCVQGNTKVSLADRSRMMIRDMVKQRHPGPVLTLEDGKLVAKRVIGWHRAAVGDRTWVNLRLGKYGRRPILRVTNDHRILCPDGWRRAGDLRTGDTVITEERHPTAMQEEIIVGTLLGDASCRTMPSQRRGRASLTFTQKNREWARLKAQALAGLGLRRTERETAEEWWSRRTNYFTELRARWYPDGKKRVDREMVARCFGPRLLATWFMDDGSFGKRGFLLHTDGFSLADVEWLAELLRSHQLPVSIYRTTLGHFYLRISVLSRFSPMIAPFMPPSMRYKLGPWRVLKRGGRWQGPRTEAHAPYVASHWMLEPAGPRYEGVEVVPLTKCDRTAWCLDVEDTHLFFAGRVAVHNCVFDTMRQADVPQDSPLWEWLPEGGLSRADGWRSLTDVMVQFARVDVETWEAQFLNRRPSPASLIYAQFDAGNITPDAKYMEHGGPLYIAYDWGFTDDSAFLFNQMRDRQFWQFDELHGSGKGEREWVRECVKRVIMLPDYDGPPYEEWEQIWTGRKPYPEPWPSVWPEAVGDPSAVQLRYEFKEHGIGARSPKAVGHKVVVGQDVMRSAILTAGGVRRYHVNPECLFTIGGFHNLRAKRLPDGRFSREPDPGAGNHVFSHPCDAERYLVWVFRKTLGLKVFTGEEEADGQTGEHGDAV